MLNAKFRAQNLVESELIGQNLDKIIYLSLNFVHIKLACTNLMPSFISKIRKNQRANWLYKYLWNQGENRSYCLHYLCVDPKLSQQ